MDNYTCEILKIRLSNYKSNYIDAKNIIELTNLPIRHQNPPEDITENIVKFVIHNYENDLTCSWSKSMKFTGDLFSSSRNLSIEVKAFTSSGPSQFSPSSYFDILYFLDMRGWLENRFVVWKMKLTSNSTEWKNVKVNKNQTMENQIDQKRRPHISFDKIYQQIPGCFERIFHGRFEDIFVSPLRLQSEQVTIEQTIQELNDLQLN
jgi:hypothetical protein